MSLTRSGNGLSAGSEWRGVVWMACVGLRLCTAWHGMACMVIIAHYHTFILIRISYKCV